MSDHAIGKLPDLATRLLEQDSGLLNHVNENSPISTVENSSEKQFGLPEETSLESRNLDQVFHFLR
jgi:hypothetical protein